MDQARLQHAVLEQMPHALVVWHLTGRGLRELSLVAANAAAARLSGSDLLPWLGRSLAEVCPAAVAQGRPAAYAALLRAGVQRPLEAGIYPELGATPVSGVLLPLGAEHVAVMFEAAANHRDDELRLRNSFLDSIVDNIPAMVFVKNAVDLRYELYNRAGEVLSGLRREDVLGRDDREVFPKEAEFSQTKDREVLQGRVMLDIPEEPLDTPSGRRWLHTKKIPLFHADGSPAHLVGISLDITERKLAVEALERAQEELELRVAERTSALQAAEEQLRHAQKMEAVGRLAGGVAHDFNNLLSVILSYTTILAEGLREHDPMAEGLTQIRKASERAADLTRQLLAFSRQQVMATRVLDLNLVLDNMSRMLRRLIGEDVELKILQAPALGRTRADPGQLEQVVMNLVVNARDAMPRGGRLTLRTQNVELDDAYADAHVGVSAGPYVMLSVADTGTGMDQATLARVFEPFFTTKKLGKGTGLGLSTVFGIVKQSGGHISAESEPAQGSTFRIYFTRTEEPLSSATPQEGTAQARGGTETVLLVEDEEQVRIIARDILLALGYRVLDAGSPSEALALSAQYGSRIDLLLTDVIMPEMNGHALSERLRQQRPELEVLYMSGYADKALDPDGVLVPGAAFLQKPITPASLTSAVRRLFDERLHDRSRSA
jgi:two-component system, cell cycle sensor histidine kinase and response regulator CckA